MNTADPRAKLEPFQALIGEWTIEMTHPMVREELEDELRRAGRPTAAAMASPELSEVTEQLESSLVSEDTLASAEIASKNLEEANEARSLAWSLRNGGGTTPAQSYLNRRYHRN
jgi:hypothetical protein